MRTSTPLLLVASAALLLLSLVAPAASLSLRDECSAITSGGGCSTGGCGGENTGSCATCIACVSEERRSGNEALNRAIGHRGAEERGGDGSNDERT